MTVSPDDAAETVPPPRVLRSLTSRLFRSSTDFLEAALTAFANGQTHIGYLHAGTALEHLAKARLAEINPLLLADRSANLKPEDLFWLAEDARHNQPAPASLRTIGLDRSLELVRHRCSIGAQMAYLDLLRAQRNGVAHFGSSTPAGDDFLPGFLAAIVAIAQTLVASPTRVFGSYREVAEAYLAQYADEERREYEIRITNAQQRFAQEHPDLPYPVVLALRSVIEDRHERSRYSVDEQLIDCPACGLPAVLDGELTLRFSVDGDGEQLIDGEFDPVSIKCSTCGLLLDSPGLLALSGALENWHVPDADLETAVQEYQSEEAEQMRFDEERDRF